MMPRWMRRARPRLERRFPRVPRSVWRRLDPEQEHAALAISIMGCLIAAAAYRGDRTDGRSALFRAAIAGFGAHAVPHIGSAVVTGGYTPGLVTTPLVVVPYSLWAGRELRRAGVEEAEIPAWAYTAVPAAIGAAHLAATAVLAVARRTAARSTVRRRAILHR